MKANRLVNWFWSSFVKGNDDKRMKAQVAPGFDDETLDIFYDDDKHPLHTLNVYKPKNSEGKLPVIFDVHGGGWYYGDKELNAYYCKSLVKHGFAVVDISYRLSPEADIFMQVKDVCEAMNYCYSHAGELGLDVENAFIAGDSAGGHIAMLISNIVKDDKLKASYGVIPKISPKAAALICPALEPLELAPLPKSFMKFYFNPVFGKGYLKNGVRELVSFKNVFRADCCPAIFISAYGDMLKNQTKAGYEKYKQSGVETELVFFDKPIVKGHKLAHVFNVLFWDWQESLEANEATCKFFKKFVN